MTAPIETGKAKWRMQRPRTAMEVYELLPETTRAEVIDNTLYIPPTPSFEHQETSMSLSASIYFLVTQNNTGKCVVAPLSVYLNEETVVEPDIIFIRTERLSIVRNGKIRGVPDLLIELLSPDNRSHNLVRKLELYQQFAVPEYLIIDPLTKEVRHYVLQVDKYIEQPTQTGTFFSQVLKSSFSF